MLNSYRNYTPFIYRLIIYGVLPFAIIAGEVSMVLYRPFLPNTHKEIVQLFVRFISMCPIAMVYTIIIVDITVFKGIYSKENRFEAYLLLSEKGKDVIKQTVIEDMVCKNLLMTVVGAIIGIISYYGYRPMYDETSFRIVNIVSIVFSGIIITQFSTWVIRHFMNWAHLLWMMAFLYTFLIPIVIGCSIAGWMNYKIVLFEIVLAIIFSLINIKTINKSLKKNWASD